MEVKFENLHFGYNRKREILHGINLTLPSNKFIAVLGPNGCGKTTTVKQINQILKAQQGSVTIDGQNVSELEPSQLARIVAYVPQMTSGVMNGSVMDTVMLGRRPYIQWKPSDKDLEIVAKSLLRLNLCHLSQHFYNQLSGGQKQTVLIARALAQTPEIYLFDEPVSFLDVRNQLEIMSIARELVERDGKTVIMVLHDLNLALRFADHVVIMKDGIVQQVGKPMELYDHPVNKFVAGFIGSPQMNFFDVVVDGDKLTFSDGASMTLPDRIASKLSCHNKKLILGIRGEDIKVDNLSLDTFKNNILQAKINDTEIMGNDNNLYFTFGNTNAVARVSKYDVKEIGETLSFIFETHHLHFFDPDTENALL